MEILFERLDKDSANLICLYIFADNNARVNYELTLKTGLVKSKIDYVYSTIGKYYDMYTNRVSFDTYEHQYRHCKGCGKWIIATRLTNQKDKLYQCVACNWEWNKPKED